MYNDNSVWMHKEGGYYLRRLASIPTKFLKSKAHAYPGLLDYISTRLIPGSEYQHYEFGKDHYELCRKLSYPDEEAAEKELLRIANNDQKHTKPNRCYQCPNCQLWHLTSKPKKNV